MRGKPAFVIFTAGTPTAPRMYDEAAQLVQDYGLDACSPHIPARTAFRPAAADGKTAKEPEPSGKADVDESGRATSEESVRSSVETAGDDIASKQKKNQN